MDDYTYASRLGRYHRVVFVDPWYWDYCYGWYDPWYDPWYGWYAPYYRHAGAGIIITAGDTLVVIITDIITILIIMVAAMFIILLILLTEMAVSVPVDI